MAQRSGLGKGLESLIPTWQSSPAPTGANEQVQLLPISSISPNPQQPRKVFEEEHLEDLAASIKQHGIIQPLIVIAAEGVDRYTLIAGERRLRAAKLAGLKEVPAIVRTASQQEQLEFASTFGVGVLFSAPIVLLYQGAISLLAGTIGKGFDQSVILEMTSVGGVILAGIAISNLLEIKKIRVGSFLPALFIVVLIVLLLNTLGIAWY